MSPEEQVRFLERQVEQLRADLAKSNSEAKKYRLGRKEEIAKASKLQEELESLKSSKPSEELAKVKAELRQERHRKEFEKVASELKVKPEALEDVWNLSRYQAETDVPDVEGMKTVLGDTLKSRPWLLQDAPKAEAAPQSAPLQPGPGLLRGQNGTATAFYVSKAELNDINVTGSDAFKLAVAEKRLVIGDKPPI